MVPEGADTDADGLLDLWEEDTLAFDTTNPDSDGDGVFDGAEDEDGDHLSARQEFLASALSSFPHDEPPRLDQRTLLVELDRMEGFSIDERSLQIARDAFADSNIDIRFFADECDVPFSLFDGSFEQRQATFAAHQAREIPNELAPSLIHVVFAARRFDEPFRPGEAISDGMNDPTRSGVFIYLEPIIEANPRCATADAPAIQVFEAVGGALTHELGHTLQLGHDTVVNGGINFYNVMAQTSSCEQAQKRHRGLGNQDPALGSTEAVGRPRFSAAATALMDFDARLSVDTGQLTGGSGREM